MGEVAEQLIAFADSGLDRVKARAVITYLERNMCLGKRLALPRSLCMREMDEPILQLWAAEMRQQVTLNSIANPLIVTSERERHHSQGVFCICRGLDEATRTGRSR